MAYTEWDELEKEECDAITADYMAAFSTPEGRRVLAHMMTELGFFDTVDDEGERILRNYAVRILRIMNAISGDTVPAWIGKMIDLAHIKPKEI